MSDIVLKIGVRENTGTGGARAARREGLVPGVIYGGERGSVAISFKENELIRAMKRGNLLAHMIDIEHDGERQPVITREIQFHPVTDQALHVDVLRVEKNTRIDVEIPVHFINEEASPGLKRGGTLNVVRHSVEVNCPAGSIPEELIADLTGLEINDSMHISAIPMPNGVKPTISDRDFTVATIGAKMKKEEEIVVEEVAADEVPTTEQEEGEEGEGEEGGENAEAEAGKKDED